ncbi:hypothetical protein Q4508_06895 [Amphritea sp. 2_MG-2023]|jgi:hypothetical protein|uniref:hypothetical protein n=1 Tax=Amphritea TaxID=515417 RepID=UPI001C07DCC7|nr:MULTISPECIES: hypothetical protein [Amphritea]MBU2967459.1 hypothetical protein [Amphritea atlantica]MDO6418286.1 hypothetical protein [Amphritea sp. 2_MG-2023]MDX2422602.1 hypothetical protein [Amphritea sp.]
MPNNHVAHLLNTLEEQSTEKRKLVDCNFAINEEDKLKVQALAELFHLSEEELVAELLHTVLLDVEEKMPYRAGTKIIRVEEGDPVYEDIGPMPRYMAIKSRLSKTTKCA